MSSRPTFPPDWATDTDFPAGANPWNGQPNKVQPGAGPGTGTVTEGFDPAAALPAETLNYMLNNHGAWISYLSNCCARVSDDFCAKLAAVGASTTGTTPGTSIWEYTTGVLCDFAIVDDHTNGGFGAAKCTPTTSAFSNFGSAVKIGVGTEDFAFRAKVRLTSAVTVASTEVQFGFNNGIGDNVFFALNSLDTKWHPYVDGVQQTALATVVPNATYIYFDIIRVSGVVYFYADSTLLYTGAYTTDLSAASVFFVTAGNEMWVDYVSVTVP